MENKNNDKEKFYIADIFDNNVTSVIVDTKTETNSCVYIEGGRTLKQTNHRLISRSKREAVQFLIDKWEAEVRRYESNLSESMAKLDKAKALLNE